MICYNRDVVPLSVHSLHEEVLEVQFLVWVVPDPVVPHGLGKILVARQVPTEGGEEVSSL